MQHKLIVYGKGANVWGECSCEIPGRGHMWAWLGTYVGAKGRLTKLRAAHAEHVAYSASPAGQADLAHFTGEEPVTRS